MIKKGVAHEENIFIILLALFVCVLSMNFTVHAHELTEIEFTDEQTVYVSSEAEFLAYPKDINTRYTFIIQPRTKATTQCPSCGRAATYYISREQVNAYTHGCYYNPLCPDVVSTYARYRYIDCSCGYNGRQFIDYSYTVYCNDTGITYAASYSTTMEQGYDPHQDINKW